MKLQKKVINPCAFCSFLGSQLDNEFCKKHVTCIHPLTTSIRSVPAYINSCTTCVRSVPTYVDSCTTYFNCCTTCARNVPTYVNSCTTYADSCATYMSCCTTYANSCTTCVNCCTTFLQNVFFYRLWGQKNRVWLLFALTVLLVVV